MKKQEKHYNNKDYEERRIRRFKKNLVRLQEKLSGYTCEPNTRESHLRLKKLNERLSVLLYSIDNEENMGQVHHPQKWIQDFRILTKDTKDYIRCIGRNCT